MREDLVVGWPYLIRGPLPGEIFFQVEIVAFASLREGQHPVAHGGDNQEFLPDAPPRESFRRQLG